MTGYAFKGSNFAIFFVSFGDQLLKDRICSSRSKFFPLRVELISRGFVIQEHKQKVVKVVSLCEIGENVPSQLKREHSDLKI